PGLRTARFPGASPTYVARTLHPDSIVSPGEAEITYLSGGKFGLSHDRHALGRDSFASQVPIERGVQDAIATR
ncbi:MAG: hypothetical protein M1134_07635, partial [Actinobacteria bacterium]|nr:hypothetical protein [Actinomycetota bacterium]MCL5445188.1 hypothetical protein [Actinomycetota bacterium]